MVSFPDDLLARVDSEARLRGTTRSGLLQEAARRELGRPDEASVRAIVARSRARFASAGRFESGELIRADRDERDGRDRDRR